MAIGKSDVNLNSKIIRKFGILQLLKMGKLAISYDEDSSKLHERRKN